MDWSYFYKHWFTTLLLGPVISQIVMYTDVFDSHSVVSFLEVYPISLIFGLIFSTPTYILYSFIYSFLAKKNTKIIYAKPILIAFAVAGVNVSFWLIGGSMSVDGALSYSIASIIAGLFFKLEFKNLAENQK